MRTVPATAMASSNQAVAWKIFRDGNVRIFIQGTTVRLSRTEVFRVVVLPLATASPM